MLWNSNCNGVFVPCNYRGNGWFFFKNEIWLLEHAPVFTLGTAADTKHLLDPKDIPVINSDRGGEVTYHGPGQLVIYFLLDVKKLGFSPNRLVSTIQNFLKDLLKELLIDCYFIKGAPGVYVDGKKIASIGLRISQGKSCLLYTSDAADEEEV